MSNFKVKRAIKILAIVLAKSSFYIYAADDRGQKVLTKKMTRSQLSNFVSKLPSCLIAMEACGSAHYWAHKFQEYGHEVKLIAPQFVKPFVKSNKNDSLDAEAICEAVQRPNMRFVSIKNEEQLVVQSVHRVHNQLVKSRTAQVNQIRGFLLEQAITIGRGRANVNKQLVLLLDEGDSRQNIPDRMKALIRGLQAHLNYLDEQIAEYENMIKARASQDDRPVLLQMIPGFGPITATAFMSHIGHIASFKNGRELAAFLGLVPRQHSTGGKSTLLGISKRGDVYLRTLLIHGARSRLRTIAGKKDPVSLWLSRLLNRRGYNIAAVVLANKMFRSICKINGFLPRLLRDNHCNSMAGKSCIQNKLFVTKAFI